MSDQEKTRKRWETRQIPCPEDPDRQAELLVEWDDAAGERVIKSITCENPRLAGIDNWDCRWSCWDEVKRLELD